MDSSNTAECSEGRGSERCMTAQEAVTRALSVQCYRATADSMHLDQFGLDVIIPHKRGI